VTAGTLGQRSTCPGVSKTFVYILPIRIRKNISSTIYSSYPHKEIFLLSCLGGHVFFLLEIQRAKTFKKILKTVSAKSITAVKIVKGVTCSLKICMRAIKALQNFEYVQGPRGFK
jgi:hypothetical protein